MSEFPQTGDTVHVRGKVIAVTESGYHVRFPQTGERAAVAMRDIVHVEPKPIAVGDTVRCVHIGGENVLTVVAIEDGQAQVHGPNGFLWVDGNGKITAGNGTLDAPKPNAFSLVQIADCPDSTEACRASCYVHGLEKHAPETHALYRHNSQFLRAHILGRPESEQWADALGWWIIHNAPHGFRWHVSGDVFSAGYAKWIADVCRYSNDVGHWIYTRSFAFLPHLIEVSTQRGGNLEINLSADRVNYARARRWADEYGLRVCYMASDAKESPVGMREGDVLFPDYALRGGNVEGRAWFGALPSHYKQMVCPVDFHGKSERRRCGPCAKCLPLPFV